MFWKRNKNKSTEPKCPKCGQVHSEWPALTYDSPANYHDLSDTEKSDLGMLKNNFCEIHYDDQIDRFIRVILVQKVNDACEDLDYGLWVSLSKKSYLDYQENFKSENHEVVYFGWLCSRINGYESTLSIPCNVETKSGNARPEIFPHESFDHPFTRDYYNGISKKEAERRIAEMLGNVK